MQQPDDLPALTARAAGGDERAADLLCRLLADPVRRAVSRFFPGDAAEVDDVVQETLLAVLDTLRTRGGFDGDLRRFAVTIGCNRSRNILLQRARRPRTAIEPLAEWIADPQRSPLDLLLEGERRALVQRALASLGRICRRLLQAFYIERRTIEQIRCELGLKTVQGVYYRRTVCLTQMARTLQRMWGRGPSGGV